MSPELAGWLATLITSLVLLPWTAMILGVRAERRLMRHALKERERTEAEAEIRRWLKERAP